MSRIAVRDRLVYPAAVVLALGAVTVTQPNPATSAPRLAAVSNFRLQAEVTSIVGGLPEASVADLVSAPGAAASASPAAASASAVGDTYPSTFLDKLVDSLPPNIRYAILPPLYVVMSVVGAIMGVFYLVFGFPKDLMPAAAVTPVRARGAAAVPTDLAMTPADPTAPADSTAPSATPGVTPGGERTASDPYGGPAANVSEDPAPARPSRGRHAVPVAAEPAAVTVSAAPAAAVAEPPDIEQAPPASASATVEVTTPDEPAVTETADPAPAATSAQESAVAHPTRTRARSADSESADPAPTRSARRSAQ